VTDHELFRSANGVLQTAIGALRRDPANSELAAQVEGYLERWTARGRCPADDPPGVDGDARRDAVADTTLSSADFPGDETR